MGKENAENERRKIDGKRKMEKKGRKRKRNVGNKEEKTKKTLKENRK